MMKGMIIEGLGSVDLGKLEVTAAASTCSSIFMTTRRALAVMREVGT